MVAGRVEGLGAGMVTKGWLDIGTISRSCRC